MQVLTYSGSLLSMQMILIMIQMYQEIHTRHCLLLGLQVLFSFFVNFIVYDSLFALVSYFFFVVVAKL